MRKDKRGIGGFMETMVAMMIVTIVISAFMTVFIYTNIDDEREPEISTDFLDGLSISNGEIVGLPKDYVNNEVMRKGYESMTICVRTVGSYNDAVLNVGVVTKDCDQLIENGTFMLCDENGGRFAAIYEVIAFV